MGTNSRYEGRPFTRLLELYVLWSVDMLSNETDEQLCLMAPKFAVTFKTEGTWQEIVAAEMEFPPDIGDHLRGLWLRTLNNAEALGVEVDPEDWARQVVDTNF